MKFPFEWIEVIHEYPRLREDLTHKYAEAAAILGEWPMVEACLHTDRAELVIGLFDSVAKAKEALDKAEEVLMCITRRTHPVGRIRWAAESAANEVVIDCRRRYNAQILALRIMLFGETLASKMDQTLDQCFTDPGYMD
jgi:hypothetical protein